MQGRRLLLAQNPGEHTWWCLLWCSSMILPLITGSRAP